MPAQHRQHTRTHKPAHAIGIPPPPAWLISNPNQANMHAGHERQRAQGTDLKERPFGDDARRTSTTRVRRVNCPSSSNTIVFRNHPFLPGSLIRMGGRMAECGQAYLATPLKPCAEPGKLLQGVPRRGPGLSQAKSELATEPEPPTSEPRPGRPAIPSPLSSWPPVYSVERNRFDQHLLFGVQPG